MLRDHEQELAAMRAERDALRAALLAFKTASRSGFRGWHDNYRKAIEQAEAALAPGVTAAPAPDLCGVLTVLERLLPQHKTDSMRGQIEQTIATLRGTPGVAAAPHQVVAPSDAGGGKDTP